MKDVGELLISFCSTPTDLLPDVLVLNCLNDCYSEGSPEPSENQLSKIISLATEATEYIGRRKQQTAILFVMQIIKKSYLYAINFYNLLGFISIGKGASKLGKGDEKVDSRSLDLGRPFESVGVRRFGSSIHHSRIQH